MPDGQRRHHDRDLVAEAALLGLGADGDRHARAQLHARRVETALAQEVRQATRDGGEHDVVDRAAESALDRLELVELRSHDGVAAVGAGGDVEGRRGWRLHRGAGDDADALDRFAHAAGDLTRCGRAGRTRDHGASRALEPLGDQHRPPGLRLRDPRLGLRTFGRLRLEVEEDRRQVRARNAVHERVMALGEQGEAAVVQSLDDVHLPQRFGAVQLLGEDPRGEPQQRVQVARLRQRGMADVVGEVELRVVDPQRKPGLERRVDHALPVARHQVQSRPHVCHELVVVRRRPVEQHDAADVHVRRRALLGEEPGVDR